MASERQIAANRANARKSSGPRSSAGKSRASRNAYRHGLSLGVGTNAPLAPQLETLARKIAGNAVDAISLERAREIAQAEFDLARVRRAKVALIESARACATADPPPMPPQDPDPSIFMVEINFTSHSCTCAKRSQFLSIYPMTCETEGASKSHGKRPRFRNGAVNLFSGTTIFTSDNAYTLAPPPTRA